jgi:hypothetical protein
LDNAAHCERIGHDGHGIFPRLGTGGVDSHVG